MSVASSARQSPLPFVPASCETAALDAALDRLTGRLDEIEHELVQLLATCSDDLCAIGNEHGQFIEAQHSHLNDVLISLKAQTDKLQEHLVDDREEIEKRFLERRNLKQLWLLCEERRTQKHIASSGTAADSEAAPHEADRLSVLTSLSEISLG